MASHHPFVTRRLQTKDQPIGDANNRRRNRRIRFSIPFRATDDLIKIHTAWKRARIENAKRERDLRLHFPVRTLSRRSKKSSFAKQPQVGIVSDAGEQVSALEVYKFVCSSVRAGGGGGEGTRIVSQRCLGAARCGNFTRRETTPSSQYDLLRRHRQEERRKAATGR